MTIKLMKYNRFFTILILIVITSCREEVKQVSEIFKLLDESKTGIDFSNNLTYDNDFNVYKYRNFYNGGGVSIGDINNDGLQDIYFTSIQFCNLII